LIMFYRVSSSLGIGSIGSLGVQNPLGLLVPLLEENFTRALVIYSLISVVSYW
jgi:hypothetical protein